jgi:hypothetical protein
MNGDKVDVQLPVQLPQKRYYRQRAHSNPLGMPPGHYYQLHVPWYIKKHSPSLF